MLNNTSLKSDTHSSTFYLISDQDWTVWAGYRDMQKNCNKRSAKNVKFYLVALIIGEAGNAFLCFCPGTRVLGETKWPRKRLGRSWRATGGMRQGLGRAGGKQSPWTGMGGTAAPKLHPKAPLRALAWAGWVGHENVSGLCGPGCEAAAALPSHPALPGNAGDPSHAGSLQPWLGRQGERHPSDANPQETGLKWVFISVSDGWLKKKWNSTQPLLFSPVLPPSSCLLHDLTSLRATKTGWELL